VEDFLGVGRCLLLPRAGGGVGGGLATTGRFGAEAEAGWGTRGVGEELDAPV